MATRARGYKILATKMACCHDCGFEVTGTFAEREARRHADETGHVPTLEVAYDIHPAPKTAPTA